MSFNAIHKNKIIAKISEITVNSLEIKLMKRYDCIPQRSATAA